VGLLQLVEIAVAVGLGWIALHAPAAAAALMIAGGVVLAWALVADGPFAVVHVVGLTVHRRALILIGLGIAALPVLIGRITDPLLLVTCGLAAAVLLRCSFFRWPAGVGPAGGDSSADAAGGRQATPATPDPPPGSGVDPPESHVSVVRRAARMTARTTTLAARQADAAAPKGARAAGRLIGRLRAGGTR